MQKAPTVKLGLSTKPRLGGFSCKHERWIPCLWGCGEPVTVSKGPKHHTKSKNPMQAKGTNLRRLVPFSARWRVKCNQADSYRFEAFVGQTRLRCFHHVGFLPLVGHTIPNHATRFK